MQFHDKCGTRLTPKATSTGSELFCSKCNEGIDGLKVLRREITVQSSSSTINVVDRGVDIEKSTVSHYCEKCKTDKAYIATAPPMRGDEDDTIAYKCANCGSVSREGMKVL